MDYFSGSDNIRQYVSFFVTSDCGLRLARPSSAESPALSALI
jgi:hypothetical protein